MDRYYKTFILFVITLFFIFISYDVSALNFSSMNIRTAYWYDGGDLYDDGFVTTNPRTLPQYVPTSSKGPVSLRLLQWRLTTSSKLAVGRYKFSFNVSFSSLNGNSINNFTDINPFVEYGAGTAYNNSVSSNLTLIDHKISVVDSLTFKFEYTFDLKSASYNFFTGIIKWGDNNYDHKFVVNGLTDIGTTPTGNSNLSYSISYASIEILNNQEIIDSLDKNTQDIIDSQDKINGSLNDDNVDSDVGTGFFQNFNDNDFGLSEIITIPLNTITSLTSKTCNPLSIPIPKTGKNISLPCMTQVYQDNIPSIFSIWQIVSFGIIAYFVAIDIFHIVKGFKDPESDKVEVLDL